MFAATQEPTDTYNERLKELRDRAARIEDAYQQARAAGDEEGMKKADHERAQVETAIGTLLEFRAGLSRFWHLYTYIAQLVDLGDPDLDNFAAFAKLLGNRLDSIPPQKVDLRGIALTGYHIKAREDARPEEPETPDTVLKLVTEGGSSRPGTPPVYIQEIIEKLNSLFGEATPLEDQVAFVNQVAAITRENAVVMAQVARNPKDQAMKGALPGAVQAAAVRAMSSHSTLATLLLSKDKHALPILQGIVYEILKRDEDLELQ